MSKEVRLANELIDLYGLLIELKEKNVKKLGLDIIEAIIESIETEMLQEEDKAA